MKLIDIIALAKAGYSKKDIEKIRNEETENGEEVNPETGVETETEVSVEAETEVGKDETDSNDIDYEKLYNDANKKLVELEEKISVIQKANTVKNLSGNEKSFEDKVKDSLEALI